MVFILVKIKCKPLGRPNHQLTLRWFVHSLGCAICLHTHQNFSEIGPPLSKLTQKDSPYKGDRLPPAAMTAFQVLKLALTTNPVEAFIEYLFVCVLIYKACLSQTHKYILSFVCDILDLTDYPQKINCTGHKLLTSGQIHHKMLVT